MFKGRTWLIAGMACVMLASGACAAAASDDAAPTASAAAGQSPEVTAYLAQLRTLHWIKGPTTVDVVGESKLDVPQGYVFLDRADTAKYLEMNHNFGDGSEMMLAPESLDWAAYFSFAAEGYVKDDEKIDAPALLKTMQEGTESANAERRKRGWSELHLTGWARPPAYNSTSKRLEWATRLQSAEGNSVNFTTKVLGRKGHTRVILVSAPEALAVAQPALDSILTGYRFNQGSLYSEFVPGDKVAEYGLAALVLGGAAAIATKKGLWAIVGTFLAATWKFLAAALVGGAAWLRRLLAKRTPPDAGT